MSFLHINNTISEFEKIKISDFYNLNGKSFLCCNTIKEFIDYIKNRSEVDDLITDNRVIKLLCRLLNYSYTSKGTVLKLSGMFLAFRDAIGYLSENGIPCLFIQRIGIREGYAYSESATKRMLEKIDFPTMYNNFILYRNDFEELLGEKFSENYVIDLGKISQVIKKGKEYVHEDEQSRLVNVLEGKRVTVGQPIDFDKQLHIYGRCGAFGYAVEDSETMPSRLQRLLNERGNRIKVVNHGLWGAEDSHIINNFLLDAKKFTNRDMVLFYQNKYDDDIMAMLEKVGLYYSEIDGEFYKNSKASWCFYDMPGHMNRDGYAIVANIISDILVNNEFWASTVFKERVNTNYWDEYIYNVNEDCFAEEIEKYINSIKDRYSIDDNKNCGAIVMNCNPFTYGHRSLIEYAASQVERLYVFVVEENKSYFDFEDRYEMVCRGTNDLENVVVVPSGKFMISAMTFPQYFMKDYVKEKEFDVTGDLEIFCSKIAPRLNIFKRFAGEEPTDVVTAHYNDSMSKILPTYGIKFIEIPRTTLKTGEIISATRVRELLQEDTHEILKYVPQSTYDILCKKYIIERGK